MKAQCTEIAGGLVSVTGSCCVFEPCLWGGGISFQSPFSPRRVLQNEEHYCGIVFVGARLCSHTSTGRAAQPVPAVHLCRNAMEQDNIPWPQSCCRHHSRSLGFFPTREFLGWIFFSSLQLLELHLSLTWELWAKPRVFLLMLLLKCFTLLKRRSVGSLQTCALFWICFPDAGGGSQRRRRRS